MGCTPAPPQTLVLCGDVHGRIGRDLSQARHL